MSLRSTISPRIKQATYSFGSQLPCIVATHYSAGATLSTEPKGRRKFWTTALDHTHGHHREPPLTKTTPIITTYEPPIPNYLTDVYWWAYVQKPSIQFLDNQFLVNMVLWGNANTLRDAALEKLEDSAGSRTLQVACVYGNFTEGLLSRLRCSSLDVIDVVPEQLERLKRKIDRTNSSQQPMSKSNLQLSCYNADHLEGFDNASFDQAVFYMLLHEMPNCVRRNAVAEAIRVLKPGGRLVFIDFHRPESLSRRFFISIWFLLEPFAKDMWSTEIKEWLPVNDAMSNASIEKDIYAGGLFQRVVVTKASSNETGRQIR